MVSNIREAMNLIEEAVNQYDSSDSFKKTIRYLETYRNLT